MTVGAEFCGDCGEDAGKICFKSIDFRIKPIDKGAKAEHFPLLEGNRG